MGHTLDAVAVTRVIGCGDLQTPVNVSPRFPAVADAACLNPLPYIPSAAPKRRRSHRTRQSNGKLSSFCIIHQTSRLTIIVLCAAFFQGRQELSPSPVITPSPPYDGLVWSQSTCCITSHLFRYREKSSESSRLFSGGAKQQIHLLNSPPGASISEACDHDHRILVLSFATAQVRCTVSPAHISPITRAMGPEKASEPTKRSGPLHFTDLPRELQKEIVSHVSADQPSNAPCVTFRRSYNLLTCLSLCSAPKLI